MTDLSHPGGVMHTLALIENDLAVRQNEFEEAARAWFTEKRTIERAKAQGLMSSAKKSVTEKKAEAELAALDEVGPDTEANYEALKAVIRVLETRAMIGMALLKTQSRT